MLVFVPLLLVHQVAAGGYPATAATWLSVSTQLCAEQTSSMIKQHLKTGRSMFLLYELAGCFGRIVAVVNSSAAMQHSTRTSPCSQVWSSILINTCGMFLSV
jgi:hypothetical protein